MKRVLSLLLIAVLAIGSISFGDSTPSSNVVTWKWLSANTSKVVILDTRAEKEYKKEHVKGAINVTWQMFTNVSGVKPGEKGFGVVLEKAALEKVLGSLGIDGKKPVVVYGAGSKSWGEEGRVAWTLQYAGLKNVKMLDSGYAEKNAKITTDAVVVKPKAVKITLGKYNTSINVTTAQVKEQLKTAKIIDSRAVAEYTGATLYGEKRGGHIPGAINLTFDSFFTKTGTVKSVKELTAMMDKAGIKKSDNIIVYCTKGIRSAQVTLVLRDAGYTKAANYDASIYEWAGDETLPLE